MHRSFKQMSFTDQFIGIGRTRSDAFFTSIDQKVDWSPFEKALSIIYSAPRGRPSYTPLMHFKIMLLQRWYDLSDPAAEDALNDRKSFARFVGLPLEERAPDHSCICRFRRQITAHDLMQPLLDELMRQIDAAGLVVRHGTLIDATMIPSAARPPSAPPREKKKDKAGTTTPDAEPSAEEKPVQEKPVQEKPVQDRQAPQKQAPADEEALHRAGKRSRVDKDARWGGKGRRAVFGYKLHIGADAEHRIIRRHAVTSANINECEIGPQLVCPDGGDHYADPAYDSASMDACLAEKGVGNAIMDRANRHHPLMPAQRRRNKLFAPIRAFVEGVFGEAKTRLGLVRARYIGLEKVSFECSLVVMAFNMKTLALASR